MVDKNKASKDDKNKPKDDKKSAETDSKDTKQKDEPKKKESETPVENKPATDEKKTEDKPVEGEWDSLKDIPLIGPILATLLNKVGTDGIVNLIMNWISGKPAEAPKTETPVTPPTTPTTPTSPTTPTTPTTPALTDGATTDAQVTPDATLTGGGTGDKKVKTDKAPTFGSGNLIGGGTFSKGMLSNNYNAQSSGNTFAFGGTRSFSGFSITPDDPFGFKARDKAMMQNIINAPTKIDSNKGGATTPFNFSTGSTSGQSFGFGSRPNFTVDLTFNPNKPK